MPSLDHFSRWAERKGKVVRWGNIIGGHIGQQFEEEFESEEQAQERERQAVNCEAITEEREPGAVRREKLSR